MTATAHNPLVFPDGVAASRATPKTISAKDTNSRTDCITDAFQLLIFVNAFALGFSSTTASTAFISSKAFLHLSQLLICSSTIALLSSEQQSSAYRTIKS